MEAIVIFIWIAVCSTVCAVAMLTAWFIARLVQGYTMKETAEDLHDFLSDMDL